MCVRICQLSALIILLFAGIAAAQEPPKEMERLKADVGTWDCEIRMFAEDPTNPQVSKGTETNVMLGGMWLISHFNGEMMGMPFQGNGQFGYNPSTKKYTGTWVDTMSPYPVTMEGTWDEKTQTLTQMGTGKDPQGNEMKMKITTVYNKDGSRLFTMYSMMPNNETVKMMEISYTKSKTGEAKSPAGK